MSAIIKTGQRRINSDFISAVPGLNVQGNLPGIARSLVSHSNPGSLSFHALRFPAIFGLVQGAVTFTEAYKDSKLAATINDFSGRILAVFQMLARFFQMVGGVVATAAASLSVWCVERQVAIGVGAATVAGVAAFVLGVVSGGCVSLFHIFIAARRIHELYEINQLKSEIDSYGLDKAIKDRLATPSKRPMLMRLLGSAMVARFETADTLELKEVYPNDLKSGAKLTLSKTNSSSCLDINQVLASRKKIAIATVITCILSITAMVVTTLVGFGVLTLAPWALILIPIVVGICWLALDSISLMETLDSDKVGKKDLVCNIFHSLAIIAVTAAALCFTPVTLPLAFAAILLFGAISLSINAVIFCKQYKKINKNNFNEDVS